MLHLVTLLSYLLGLVSYLVALVSYLVVLVVCLVALVMSGACGFIWPDCAWRLGYSVYQVCLGASGFI